MTTATLDGGPSAIGAFLLARIAEDEAVARTAAEQNWAWRTMSGVVVADRSTFPARVLAECDVKRRLVEAVQYLAGLPERMTMPDAKSAYMLEEAIQAMAAIYADHPDYREEWRL
jgi:hypothetical protein